ncbi:hypothetical protein C8A05DRAFT_48310 [Staphylotrichum tortipilum]|uniref:Chromo domain-containing protein n=1 Tax=Staphylotrichum tortipilum TaxID=2831512 RepID=A0AAN6RN30_9PEZI|nr:hypothetical protein C8A05DRAFT_48310 [Staphylotrichum longicolle]
MPSHTFSCRTQATPLPVVGLTHSNGPAATASLNILITITTTIWRRTRMTSPSRPMPYRPRSRPTEEMSTMSQPVLAHSCSHPPAETKPVAEVVVRGHSASVVDVAMPMRRAARARLRTNSPSQPAQQGPKRRQSQQRASNPQSSGASALGEETPEAAFASFEEWPLEAVLKRVWVGGAATFQVEFTWNPCMNHGRHERAPENPRRKSPTEEVSSARTLSSRVASTTEKVQGDEYFNVEEILKWRQGQGEEGPEYLVKWAGYGNKHNSWEPAAHFEQFRVIAIAWERSRDSYASCDMYTGGHIFFNTETHRNANGQRPAANGHRPPTAIGPQQPSPPANNNDDARHRGPAAAPATGSATAASSPTPSHTSSHRHSPP